MRYQSRDAESRAARLLERGRVRAALAVATVALCRDSEAASLWLLRATIHHSLQEWDKALDDVEHAMMLVPLPVHAQLVLADCCWFTDRHALALLAYEHLLKAVGEEPPVYAAVYAGLVRCGRRDLALRCCRVAVASNPDDHAALFAMAHCMVALKYDATYVAAVLRQAVQVAPDREVYRVSLAIQLTRCGCHEEAYGHLEATSTEQLSQMTCACSIGRLVRLCLWANDHDRVAVLTDQLRALQADAQARDKE